MSAAKGHVQQAATQGETVAGIGPEVDERPLLLQISVVGEVLVLCAFATQRDRGCGLAVVCVEGGDAIF